MSFSLPLRPLAVCAVLAATLGLSACGSGGSSSGDSSAATLPPDIQTRAELGCAGVAGTLDGLQTTLANSLTSGLSGQPAVAATTAQLTALVNDVLDLVDATAGGAASLQALSSGGDPQLVAPVLDQLLCVTAAAGEILLSVTIAASTPVADRVELNGLLDTIVDLQAQLSTALGQIAAGGAGGPVAGILQQVTNTLSGVLSSPLGLTSLPGGGVVAGVLAPASDLLFDVSGSFGLLQGGDEQGFADALLGSVTHLVDGLVASLGPLGVVLTPVLNLLSPVVALLSQLLAGLLGIAL